MAILSRPRAVGVYERVEALISTGEETKSMAIVQLQKTTLDLAKRAFWDNPLALYRVKIE